ncbi:DUF4360 domain-containing protein [Pilimelia columellifera]|uniref:DUF4360 domain-containing protein n=1 Tax=Pilimelia columellifera subsp. columellifera TaxID=706583 RepID=A0ABN3N986_9ACTN
MKKTTKLLAAATAGAGLWVAALPAPSFAEEKPKAEPQIEVVGVSGSGCKKDTTQVVVDPNGGWVTAIYDTFTANTPPKPALKACTLVLRVTTASGYRIGMRQAAFSGDAMLRPGGSAEFKAKYFWQGGSHTEERVGWQHDGSYEGSWSATHELKDFWGSRCEGQDQLIITQSLKAQGSGHNSVGMNYGTFWNFVTEAC